jgi:hypothetical protein
MYAPFCAQHADASLCVGGRAAVTGCGCGGPGAAPFMFNTWPEAVLRRARVG